MKTVFGCVLAAALLSLSGGAQAAKIQVGEDGFIDVRVLMQGQGQLRDGAAADGRGMGTDFFLRRARLLLLGGVNENITFFIETDSPNFGKGGNYDANIFVQDAFASFKLREALVFDVGLIIVPLTRHSFQGAVSLNSLDYHSFLVKHPAGSTKIWRDTGVQARGTLLDSRLHYRIGVFGGVRSQGGRLDSEGAQLPDLNPDGTPRVAGHVRFNLFDPEEGFFPAGIYFGKKKVVSFGIGADFQSKAVATRATVANGRALGGDLFVDLPIGADQEFIFQADVISYHHGDESAATGLGFFAEAGYRYGKIEPVVAYQRFFSTTGAGDLQGVHVGLNYWLHGHTANVKAEVAIEKNAAVQKVANLGEAGNRTAVTLQTQLFF